MAEKDTDNQERYTEPLSHRIQKEYAIGDEFYHGEVKKGLRNSDGTGVLVGVTKVGSVQGYLLQDGQRVPTPGRLYYRGIELHDIVEAHRKAGTFGFEEVAYLLLMGYLPTQDELARFNGIMSQARKLPDGIVSVCSDENNAVNIACGNADYNISGTASDDFPDLPSLDYCSNLSLPQDTMARMIAETSFAISTNESRPVYTGALIEVDDNIMTMVAVDGYRMALRREPVETCDVESLKFIVPGAALSDLEKICMSPEEPVKIAVGSKHVSFSVGDTVLISRRLEGEFLNFRTTVPGDFPIQLKAQRAELIRCTDRVSLIIDDRTKNPLRCVFGENMLTITCATPLGRAEGSISRRGGRADGLPSLTEYEVLQVSGRFTLLRLRPQTGRTHQHRVHMAYLGHPLAGDWLYGTEDKTLIARPALHSYELWFTQPVTGQELHFTAPIPQDMQRLME